MKKRIEIVLNDIPLLETKLYPEKIEKNDTAMFWLAYYGERGEFGTDEIYRAVEAWDTDHEKESDTNLMIRFSLKETLDYMIEERGGCVTSKQDRIMYRKIKRILLETVEKINAALKKEPGNA